jgi:hypothetical protein
MAMTTQEKILQELEKIPEGMLKLNICSHIVYDQLQTSPKATTGFVETTFSVPSK